MTYYGECACGKRAVYFLEFEYGPPPTLNGYNPKYRHDWDSIPLCAECRALEERQEYEFYYGSILEIA